MQHGHMALVATGTLPVTLVQARVSGGLRTPSPALRCTPTVSQAGATFAADLANDAQVPEDTKAQELT